MSATKVEKKKPASPGKPRAKPGESDTSSPLSKPVRALRFLPRRQGTAREPRVPGQYLG